MAVDENDLNLLKNDLRACLLSKKNGISIARLLREFEDLTCESLDFRKFGSYSLEEFLRTKCRDVCRFGYDVKNPGIARIIAVANEDTQHIEALQKNTRQNKVSPPVRRRFAPNFVNTTPYMGQQQRMVYNTEDNRWSSSRFGRGRHNGINEPWRRQNTPSTQPRSGLGNSQSGSLMGPAPVYLQHPLIGLAPQSRSMIIQAPGQNQPRQVSFNTPQGNKGPSVTSQVGSTAKPPRMSETKSSSAKSRSKSSASKRQSDVPVEVRKRPQKVTRASWHTYGNYLLPILQKKKFGAMKGDVERDYEDKYKECLPENWVQELEDKFIKIANNYGDGMLLLQALPKETIDKVNQEVKAQKDAIKHDDVYDDVTPPSSPNNCSIQEVEEMDVVIKELTSNNQASKRPASMISAFPTIDPPSLTPSSRISSHTTSNQTTENSASRISSQSSINQSTNSSAQRISSHPTIDPTTLRTPTRIINNNTQTSEASKTRRVTDEEMKKLEDHEKLYESRSRYTPAQKLSQRKILRRPKLYELANPSLSVPMNHDDQRVPSSGDDICLMNGNNDDTKTGRGGRANPTMEERFSKYRDNEDIFWSDDSSVGSDLEWEDQPSFLKSPIARADCICDRERTLVFCSFCCFSVGDARVKTVCQVHRNHFETYDLLVCPQCISEYIVELKETVY